MQQIDALVIGGGVVGCAILKQLAEAGMRVALAEAGSDVGQGISRANTAIAHTGFDAPPGTLEARLVSSAHRGFAALCQRLGVDTRPCGALMVALDAADLAQLATYEHKAAQNGIAVERVDPATLLAKHPYLNRAVQGGLRIPGEMPVDSFALTIALARAAIAAGAAIWLDEAVQALEPHGQALDLTTAKRRVRATWVINAAGLAAARIAALVGDESFAIRPRKGQLIVIDPAKAPPIDTILLPTPSPTTKGILITPAAHGNLLLGPTAEDSDDAEDWSTTPAGLAQVFSGVQRLVPSLHSTAAITQYAGLRSVGYERTGDQLRPASDYIIRPAVGCPNLIHVAGIRSTGLSGAPAIAAYIAELVGAGRHASRMEPVAMQHATAATTPVADIPSSTQTSPAHLICPCSGVGLAQARAAIHSAPIAQTLDALKRRLWCMAGPCQGAWCIADLVALLANELAVPLDQIRKHADGSEILVEAWPTPRQVPAIVPAGRERHRGDLLISGTRPAGVYSAGATLRLLAYGRPGTRAVLIGNAPWRDQIAAHLSANGIAIVATIAGTEIIEILGWPRVSSVRQGQAHHPCDLAVLCTEVDT
jgi:glycerol-3-phosphate dehydrogenase